MRFLSRNAEKQWVLAILLVLLAFGLSPLNPQAFAQSSQTLGLEPPNPTSTGDRVSLAQPVGVSSEEFENFLKIPTPYVSDRPATKPVRVPQIQEPQVQPPQVQETEVQVAQVQETEVQQPQVMIPLGLPISAPHFAPWWPEKGIESIMASPPQQVCRADLEQLIWQSMQYSPRVKSILILPKIQRTEVDVQRGEFDPRRFGQSLYNDNSDPVGNTLTTGGPSRLNEQFWDNSIGIRDRNTLGGKSELSQQIGAKDNNSLFFKPNNQIDSRLSLNYTQPLLRGAGRIYNTSSIAIAGFKTKGTVATANRELQDHAMEVITAYWELTLHRYLLLQANNGQARLIRIKEQLQNRSGRDLLPSYLKRADAEIFNQRAQADRAIADILGRQATLRRLVNAPELDQCIELIPLTIPSDEYPEIPLEDEIASALLYRGDIAAIRASIESAMVQRQVAQNERKAILDLVANSYLRGLEGNNELSRSWQDQFDTGRPSFTFGATYQDPIYRRTAKASLLGRELEIQKLLQDHADAILKAQEQVTTVVASAQGTYRSSQSAIEGTMAQQAEVEELQVKLLDFFGDSVAVGLTLNNLLDAEKRLIAAENNLATQQVQFMIGLARIKYESGSLMTISAD